MPRQKLTRPEDPRRKGKRLELIKLTAKQLKFCELILTGMSQTEAYLTAYDCRQTMSREAAQVQGSRLRSHPMIALWLDAAMTASTACTFEAHIAELERLKAIAIRTGNVGAAVLAEQLRGKASGHYVEQYAMVTYDPVATLMEIAQTRPELAQQLAEEHGIPWATEPRVVN